MSNTQRPRALNRGSGLLQRPRKDWHGKPRGGGQAAEAALGAGIAAALRGSLGAGWAPGRPAWLGGRRERGG